MFTQSGPDSIDNIDGEFHDRMDCVTNPFFILNRPLLLLLVYDISVSYISLQSNCSLQRELEKTIR